MKFHCISTREDDSTRLLKDACEKKDVSFNLISAENFDYSKKIILNKEDLLFRVETTKRARDVEKFLLNKNVTTFYKNYERALSSIPNILMYEKNNISTPKTIYRLTKNRKLLKSYGKILGFPLIIKAVGGSHGVGILKIDSPESLFSITDYLLSKNINGSFVLKKFINVRKSARLIVLKNKVIDSIEYIAPEGDFRSNEGKTPNVQKARFNSKIEKTAIRATQILNLEFSGVDILIDERGKHYLAETNFPCFFPRAQMLTKTPIAEMMLDYLIKKSSKK